MPGSNITSVDITFTVSYRNQYKVTKVYDSNLSIISLEKAFKHYQLFDHREQLINIQNKVKPVNYSFGMDDKGVLITKLANQENQSLD